MHFIVAPFDEKKNGTPATFAGILREALIPGARLEPSTVPFEHGDAAWGTSSKGEQGIARQPATAQEPLLARRADGTGETLAAGSPPSLAHIVSSTPPLVAPSSAHALRSLARENPSGLEGGPQVDLRKRLRLGNAAALDRGSLIHAWFELIEWLDEGEPDDVALRDAAHRSGARSENLQDRMNEFRTMLRQPAIREALLRPVGSLTRSFELWRERPFVIRWDDALLAGKFDRVVLTIEGSRVIRAEVLDFKTDAISVDDAGRSDPPVEQYRSQLDAYRDAVRRLVGLDASAVGARLLFVSAGVVRDL